MKKLILSLILCGLALAQAPQVSVTASNGVTVTVPNRVTVTIDIDGQKRVMELSDSVRYAWAMFIAETTEVAADGTQKAKYVDVSDLMAKHVYESLSKPLVARYPTADLATAGKAAEDAAAAFQQAADVAAAPVVAQ